MKKILKKNLRAYIIPSMIITTMSVFHSIIDGYFIGQNIGDSGLAAINISIPLLALISSIATGIGLGGAVSLAINQGQSNLKDAKKSIANTITLLAISSIIITFLLLLFKRPLLIFLGANQNTLPLASDYISILAVGSIFQIISLGINPLIRNIDEPIRAMAFILSGLVLNIILNNLFVKGLGLGLVGVALATILGQALSAILSIFNILMDKTIPLDKNDFYLDKDISRHILKLSTSSFGSAFLPYAIIILTNWQIIKYGGDHALAAFSILSYASQIVAASLQGISYGAQPLISFYNGSNKPRLIEQIKEITLKIMVSVALVFVVLAISIRNKIPFWFGVSPMAGEIIKVDMIISSISFIPSAIVKFTQSYFYALDKAKLSNILIYLELLVVVPLLLHLLPLRFGLSGVWYTTPVSQIILALIATRLLKTYDTSPLRA